MTDRAATMIAMYRSGQTLQQIGSTFGVTRERARQILAKHGITCRPRRALSPHQGLHF
jgi:DNA-directed RNA polymerase sigma subunit (sigma70/sigma32)